MDRKATVSAAVRRVRWRERLFGLARPLLPSGSARWSDGGLILLYHRLDDAGSPPIDPFAVTAAAFDRQIGWLADHFTVVTVRELVARMARRDARGLAAVTFDDGYHCTVERALPVLQAHNVPATVFVDTGRLNHGSGTLRETDVRALSDAGIEIGSHTVTHPNLLEVDDVVLGRELRDSRERLVALTGQPVGGFAHPFGRYDARVSRAVRQAGYAYACTCRQHRTNEGGDDPYQLTRVEINASDDQVRFESKARGRYARLYAAWYRMNPATRAWVRS
jgi:peptidoglycan/xylan/chitin deacetylase (PgdA/CDA1 family)